MNKCFTGEYHASFRLDLIRYGGGIILYILEDTPPKVLCHDLLFGESFLSKLICTKRSRFLTVLMFHTRIILLKFWN